MSKPQGITMTCAVCLIPCGKKCSKCVKVAYCGVEHQKQHRKIHSKDCFPATLLSDSKFGQYMAATRKISAGEVILIDEPILVSPYLSPGKLGICFGCCQVLTAEFGCGKQVCQKCSWPLCNPNCKEGAWHFQNECGIFQKHRVNAFAIAMCLNSPTTRLICEAVKILRILIGITKDASKAKLFSQLKSHVEDVKKNKFAVLKMEEEFVIDFIQKFCGQTQYSGEQIREIFGVAQINTHVDTDVEKEIKPGDKVESYICYYASKINHDCIANTKRINLNENEGKVGAYRLIATAEIGSGEMLTECYGFNRQYWNGITERRQNLKDSYYFWCTCPRCSDPTELGTFASAIKCIKNQNCKGFYLPKNSLSQELKLEDLIWQCTDVNCKSEIKYSKISGIAQNIQYEIEEAKDLNEKLKILDMHANVSLHENHVVLMKLRFDLLRPLLIEVVNLKQKNQTTHMVLFAEKLKEFSIRCLEMADKLAPGLTVFRGALLYYYGRALDYLNSTSVDEPNIDVNRFFEKLMTSVSVEKEAMEILRWMPKDTNGFTMFQDMKTRDNKLNEIVDTFTSRIGNINIG